MSAPDLPLFHARAEADRRRPQPRREVDAAVHYATEALLGAALDIVDRMPGSDDPDHFLDVLDTRAAAYRKALTEAAR